MSEPSDNSMHVKPHLGLRLDKEIRAIVRDEICRSVTEHGDRVVARVGPREALTLEDYEEALASHRALVRQIDIMINGEDGAAKQASLCDLMGQLEHIIRQAKASDLF